MSDTDTQKWLMSHGIITDIHKDNIFMFGSILHAGIIAADVDIDVANKRIDYKLYTSKKMHLDYYNFHKYMKSNSIWNLWRAKRLIKKHTFLDWSLAIEKFVEGYCGPGWKTSTEVLLEKSYEPIPGNE